MQMSTEKLHFDILTFKNHVFTNIYICTHAQVDAIYMFILTLKGE
jgi:hypothetical protein